MTKESGSKLEAFGLGLLLWGMVDRPMIIFIAAAVLITAYTVTAYAEGSKLP